MMKKTHINERLSFSCEESCTHITDGSMAVVHACKTPCHKNEVGYEKNLSSDHPDYLARDTGHHLYMNLIDPPVPLFKLESFDIFLGFVDREITERPVLIHCNQGRSRAPSLALLYMAKRLELLPPESYEAARGAFEQEYPYSPGRGIEVFLAENWHRIV